MDFSIRIALRYLFAKKSHNVINLISAVSAIGIGVGVTALILILSVYNGFDDLVKSMSGCMEADLLVKPAKGKFFTPEEYGDVFKDAAALPQIKSLHYVVQDNVFLRHSSSQGTAVVKGIDAEYEADCPIADYVKEGEFRLHRGEIPMAAVGRSLANSLDINPDYASPLELYSPDRNGKVNLINPMANIRKAKVMTACIFSVGNEYDVNSIIVPIETMRSLLGLTDEVTGVEIRFNEGVSKAQAAKVKKRLSAALGDDLCVLDRSRQNPSLYKMLRYEKLGVYLIMFFIVLILGFSIFGSLRMLSIEKEEDIFTLSTMGAEKSAIRRIFVLEGWMICLSGLIGGLILGITFTLIQQHTGIVKMPGSYIIESYPVVLQWGDVLITTLSVALCGYLICRAAGRKIKI